MKWTAADKRDNRNYLISHSIEMRAGRYRSSSTGRAIFF
jgi:hypothetical protein